MEASNDEPPATAADRDNRILRSTLYVVTDRRVRVIREYPSKSVDELVFGGGMKIETLFYADGYGDALFTPNRHRGGPTDMEKSMAIEFERIKDPEELRKRLRETIGLTPLSEAAS